MSQSTGVIRAGIIVAGIVTGISLGFAYRFYTEVETRTYYRNKLNSLFGYNKTQDTQHNEDESTTVVNIVDTSDSNDISHAYGH
jgi:hypothetical protein